MQVKTTLQVLTLQRETDKVLARKHMTAFAPDLIHSLDGSHMMITAVAGLSFAGGGEFPEVLPKPNFSAITIPRRLWSEINILLQLSCSVFSGYKGTK
ncbi:unnamed protein product [Microthlaspi erraticum]|uniref:DNA-directed RNA polymerase n=1 Tax=Microthlaspi erraticum TaxID=1685480 RepID=A0A6D2LF47_9BRAS|nr:unnamed protein product [Microthlaspi erraticum]